MVQLFGEANGWPSTAFPTRELWWGQPSLTLAFGGIELMAMNRSLLVLMLVALCVGCAGLRDSRLESHRQALAATCSNDTLPMNVRMAALDDLLDTFTSGTREPTLDRFVGSLAVAKSRVSGYLRDDGTFVPGNTFQLRLIAPDGSGRWITLTGNRVL